MTLSQRLPPPSSSKTVAGLDHLRALAIILVFVYHYAIFDHPEWIRTIGSFGWSGVDLFFVLSGYLIGKQLLGEVARRQSIDLKAFYLKRFFRIIPAYAVVLACYFAIPGFREKPTIAPLWKFISFTQNFGLNLSTQRAFSHAWSLCIEEQFYLILPLMILTLAYFRIFRKSWWVLIILLVAGLLLRYWSLDHFVVPLKDDDDFGTAWYQYIYYPTYNRLDGLLAGIAIAAGVQFKSSFVEILLRYGNLLFGLGLLLFAGAWIFCSDQMSLSASVFGFPLIALAYGTLIMAGLSPSCIFLRTASPITSFIARISYSVYLSHKACIHLTQEALTHWGIATDTAATLLICVLSALAGGCLLHFAVERPFLRIRETVVFRKRAIT